MLGVLTCFDNFGHFFVSKSHISKFFGHLSACETKLESLHISEASQQTWIAVLAIGSWSRRRRQQPNCSMSSVSGIYSPTVRITISRTTLLGMCLQMVSCCGSTRVQERPPGQLCQLEQCCGFLIKAGHVGISCSFCHQALSKIVSVVAGREGFVWPRTRPSTLALASPGHGPVDRPMACHATH